jgi:hypothetical protein
MKKQRKKEKPSAARHNCGAKKKLPALKKYAVTYHIEGKIIEKITGHKMTENADSNKVIIADFKDKAKIVKV